MDYSPWGPERVRHDIATKQEQQRWLPQSFFFNFFRVFIAEHGLSLVVARGATL